MEKELFARPGEIIEAWSRQVDFERPTTVLRTARMEVLRLHLCRGVSVPTHEMLGEMTILCLQGCTFVMALGHQNELRSGQLLYLLVNEPFDLVAIEESALLITVLRGPEKTIGQ
jgi:quercetin dioxygenase-like cupin family protein